MTGPAKNLLGFCRWTRSSEAAAANVAAEFHIATYCRYPGNGSGNAFVQASRNAGIPTHIIPERFRFDPAVPRQMAALVQQLRPDIVQTHNVKSHFLFRLSGARARVCWLAFQHGYTTTDLKMKAYNQLDRWSLRAADRVVTVCGAFVPQLTACGVDLKRVRVLHNSVQPPAGLSDEARETAARWNIRSGEPVLLSIGRFSPEKGHADLIQALYFLDREAPALPWKALIVGDGPERPRVETLIERLELGRRVTLAGFHSRVSSFYSIATVFVLPSHSEGSSNVLLEAMACGVPVAATRVGGTPEIVAHEQTALLVPPRNPAEMARALRRLLEDPPLQRRLSDAARLRAERDFSQEQYIRSLLGIYSEVFDQRSDAPPRF